MHNPAGTMSAFRSRIDTCYPNRYGFEASKPFAFGTRVGLRVIFQKGPDSTFKDSSTYLKLLEK